MPIRVEKDGEDYIYRDWDICLRFSRSSETHFRAYSESGQKVYRTEEELLALLEEGERADEENRLSRLAEEERAARRQAILDSLPTDLGRGLFRKGRLIVDNYGNIIADVPDNIKGPEDLLLWARRL